MTELCGAACAMPPGDASTSTIGVLFPMYEAKLRDVPSDKILKDKDAIDRYFRGE